MSFLRFGEPACVFLVFLTWQDLKDEKQTLMEEKEQQGKTSFALACMSFLWCGEPACIFLVFLPWQDLSAELQKMKHEKQQQEKISEAQFVLKSLLALTL